MFYLMKVEKTDKSKIYTYTAKLTLIKIIVYLVLNLKTCFPVISLCSNLVMCARFRNVS